MDPRALLDLCQAVMNPCPSRTLTLHEPWNAYPARTLEAFGRPDLEISTLLPLHPWPLVNIHLVLQFVSLMSLVLKRPTRVSKETYTRVSKETYSSVKRELHMSLVFVLIPLWINKLTPFDSIASYVAKETYTSVQRDVH